MRHRYFTGAHNSLCETLGAMDLARTIDVVSQEHADSVQRLGVRLERLLRALMQ